MIQEPTISNIEEQIKKIQNEQIEYEKCAQRTIQLLQQQINDCMKEIRSLKSEIQNTNSKLKK